MCWYWLLISFVIIDKQCTFQVRIAIVGKYTGLTDAYLSVLKVISFLFFSQVSVSMSFITKWSSVISFLFLYGWCYSLSYNLSSDVQAIFLISPFISCISLLNLIKVLWKYFWNVDVTCTLGRLFLAAEKVLILSSAFHKSPTRKIWERHCWL